VDPILQTTNEALEDRFIGPSANENEVSGLKCVLGVVVIAEDTATDAPSHWPVPLHQGFKGRRLSAVHEALQELPIGQFPPIRQQGAAKVVDDVSIGVVGIRLLVRVFSPLYSAISCSSQFYRRFSLDRAGMPMAMVNQIVIERNR
jgi:hypothetical protein